MLYYQICFLTLVGVIILYYYYLNIETKKTKIIKENFENELGDIVNTNTEEYKIKKLIETEVATDFGIRVWDNHSKLKSIYSSEIPQTRDKCPQKDKNNNVNCPISIWRPSPSNGYSSLGDVGTITFMSPRNEKIVDVRADKSPGNIYNKNIDTISVAGAELKDPIDYLYVGGFGNGKMLDRLEKNEEYYRLIAQLKFYGTKLSEALNNKKSEYENIIKKYQINLNSDFGAQINQLKKSSPIKAGNPQSQLNINKFIGSDSYNNKDALEFLRDQPIVTGNVFIYNVEESSISLNNPYNIEPLMDTLPPSIVSEMQKSLKDNRGWGSFKIPVCSYMIWNLQSVEGVNRVSVFGNEPGSTCHSDSNLDFRNQHGKFTSLPGVQMEIVHNIARSNGMKVTNNSTLFGKVDDKDQTCLIFHGVEGNDVETLNINRIRLRIHAEIINNGNNVFKNDDVITKLYDGFKNTVDMLKQLYPDLTSSDYKRLSIWQPVPPEGYIALGFIFTNDPETSKPGDGLCKCIPENCAKQFKRRQWDPESDLIYRYKDNEQDLAFYRNPYLNTLVVMDEKKQNGVFKGKTPNHLNYRTVKDSKKWECFDIIPCIKECDYVSRLEDADKRARNVCKAYSGLENQYFEKEEYRKSILDEEKKLRDLVKERHTHITFLMEKLNKIMSEEDLYKMINRGLNRYKLKTDLEKQRKLHGQVADKLMSTKGLEINWNAPQDLKTFKDLIQRYIIAKFSVQTPKRDCPVCKLPEQEGYVKMENLEMCYGCLEDVVRELVNKKKAEGSVPQELKELEDKIMAKNK
uniref:Uncharacterized protein n=1 Tax=viral metagenome TaxID=1070528 RepID=A0A6C0E792_9ZZZZ